MNTLIQGDCLEKMKDIADGSVDMILCDLPYGTTACKWDKVIPFEPLWAHYKRVIKPNGAIVLFGSQPFTSALVMSNVKMFKYCWYWIKTRPTGFANSKRQPMRNVEDIAVFYNKGNYKPQGLVRVDKVIRNGKSIGGDSLRGNTIESIGKGSLRTPGKEFIMEFANYPRQTLRYSADKHKVHPTQKPVALLEYLIRTYTNEGETVLDNTMGSGTTGVACKNLNRSFIGIEMDADYFKIAESRINDTHS